MQKLVFLTAGHFSPLTLLGIVAHIGVLEV